MIDPENPLGCKCLSTPGIDDESWCTEQAVGEDGLCDRCHGKHVHILYKVGEGWAGGYYPFALTAEIVMDESQG